MWVRETFRKTSENFLINLSYSLSSISWILLLKYSILRNFGPKVQKTNHKSIWNKFFFSLSLSLSLSRFEKFSWFFYSKIILIFIHLEITVLNIQYIYIKSQSDYFSLVKIGSESMIVLLHLFLVSNSFDAFFWLNCFSQITRWLPLNLKLAEPVSIIFLYCSWLQ